VEEVKKQEHKRSSQPPYRADSKKCVEVKVYRPIPFNPMATDQPSSSTKIPPRPRSKASSTTYPVKHTSHPTSPWILSPCNGPTISTSLFANSRTTPPKLRSWRDYPCPVTATSPGRGRTSTSASKGKSTSYSSSMPPFFLQESMAECQCLPSGRRHCKAQDITKVTSNILT